jgi:nucleotide-binding universal stress UspA family protein
MLIAHTAPLSEDDTALAHALALAVHGKARLASVHACAGPDQAPELPAASVLLRRWGLPEDSVIHDRIVHTCCDDVTDTLLDALRGLAPDLIVAATHARTGLARLFSGSVAEGVARNVRVPTLLLPFAGECFVDRENGRVNLKRMLVPAGSQDEAQQAIDAAVALAQIAGVHESELVLVHVEDGRAAPEIRVPSGFSLVRLAATGPLEAAVVELGHKLEVCLLVMTTHGHDGLSDVVLGSHTERVLHALGRPLLWVPFEPTLPRA